VNIAGAAYDVVLADDFGGVGDALAERLPRGRCVVVTNPVVGPLHATGLLDALAGAGWTPVVLEVPDGEQAKRLDAWAALVDALLDARVDRRTPVLALGGGVTGDLVGFAAASVLRGVPFVQVPTTLLAMVDASVGGKTGVNTRQGKNLVGAFHQPSLVWAPFGALGTLPDDELRCGLGEVVKHAVIAGEDALLACEALAPALVRRDPDALRRVVADSVRTKARIVADDPLEHGARALLNLGHTLGHALEQVCGYGVLRHGEAVALGLLAIARWGESTGALDRTGLSRRLESLLRALGLPTRPPSGLDPGELARAVGFDKKRERGRLRVVLPLAPGRVVLHDLPGEQIPSLVAALFPHHTASPTGHVEPE
jgi:3-dehydroquinate synthase